MSTTGATSTKILRHPRAGEVGDTASGDETRAVSGLPGWFYILLLVGLPAAIVLKSPFNILLAGVLWIYYLVCVVQYPERAILVFLITMGTVKLTLGRGIPLLRGLNSDTIFVLTLAACAIMSRRRQPNPWLKNPYAVPVLVFVFIMTASAVLSYGTGSAQLHSWSRGWYYYPAVQLFSKLKSDVWYVLIAVPAFRLLWNREQLRAAINVVAIFAATISLEGLWMRSHIHFAPGEKIPKFIRAAGTIFREPNSYGGFLALMTVMLVPVFLDGKQKLQERLLLGGALAAILSGLIYSFSRGAWLSTVAGFLLVGLLRGAKGVVALMILALTASFWIPQAVIDRYEHTVRESQVAGVDDTEFDNSTESRLLRWQAVPEMFMASPIWGHGYSSFSRMYGVLNDSGHATGAHSTITEFAIEEGLIGIGAYLWLLFIPWWAAMRLRGLAQDPLVLSVCIGVAAGIPTLGLLDISGRRFLSDPLLAAVWLLACCLTRLYWNHIDPGPAELPHRSGPRPLGRPPLARTGRT